MFDKKALTYKAYSEIRDEVTDYSVIYDENDDYIHPYLVHRNSKFVKSISRSEMKKLVVVLRDPSNDFFEFGIKEQSELNLEKSEIEKTKSSSLA